METIVKEFWDTALVINMLKAKKQLFTEISNGILPEKTYREELEYLETRVNTVLNENREKAMAMANDRGKNYIHNWLRNYEIYEVFDIEPNTNWFYLICRSPFNDLTGKCDWGSVFISASHTTAESGSFGNLPHLYNQTKCNRKRQKIQNYIQLFKL